MSDTSRQPKRLRRILDAAESIREKIPTELPASEILYIRAVGIPEPFRYTVLTGEMVVFIDMQSGPGSIERVLETIDEWKSDPEQRLTKKYYGKNAPSVVKAIWLTDVESIAWSDLSQSCWLDASTPPMEGVVIRAAKESRSRGRKLDVRAMDGDGFGKLIA